MTYQLTITPLGETLEVEEGQTMLDAALRAGVFLPHACGHGLCGTCKVAVVEGEVEHGEASDFALMDVERQEGKTLACCATLESDVTIEADVDEEPDAQGIPVQDVEATVSRLERLTKTIMGVWLQPDQSLPFQAGQYVNLNLPDLPSRPFSLANAPGADGPLELHIRAVPDGAVTTYIHEKLQVGDRVTLSGPRGRFFVRKSASEPLLFIAGGSGLASPRSMILDLLHTDRSSLPITLIYGQRTRDELYYHDELLKLAQEYPQLTYLPVLSDEPEDSSWTGARGMPHEFAQGHFAGDFRGHNAYLCGPPPMIEACIQTLMQGRLFERHIFTEKFLTHADASQPRSPLFKRI